MRTTFPPPSARLTTARTFVTLALGLDGRKTARALESNDNVLEFIARRNAGRET